MTGEQAVVDSGGNKQEHNTEEQEDEKWPWTRNRCYLEFSRGLISVLTIEGQMKPPFGINAHCILLTVRSFVSMLH